MMNNSENFKNNKLRSKKKGEWGENLAARFLCEKGYSVISRNYSSRFGEIDIIAVFGAFIVFVEVKARGANAIYKPKEAVTRAKQQKIVKTALMFLSDCDSALENLQPRFDVIEIESRREDLRDVKINHIISAFETEDIYEF